MPESIKQLVISAFADHDPLLLSAFHPHKLVSQEISPSPKCSPGHISHEIWPHGSISGNLAPSYDTYKNLSIFHESVSIMNTLDKST